MGISYSPDIFQENMSDLMQNINFVRTYLDDLLVILSGTLDDHLEKLEVVFKLLSDKGLRVNAEESTLLKYSHSRNPTRVRAHTQRHIQAPREPLNLGGCLRVCALSKDRVCSVSRQNLDTTTVP
jgi:hypothetical protein